MAIRKEEVESLERVREQIQMARCCLGENQAVKADRELEAAVKEVQKLTDAVIQRSRS